MQASMGAECVCVCANMRVRVNWKWDHPKWSAAMCNAYSCLLEKCVHNKLAASRPPLVLQSRSRDDGERTPMLERKTRAKLSLTVLSVTFEMKFRSVQFFPCYLEGVLFWFAESRSTIIVFMCVCWFIAAVSHKCYTLNNYALAV